MPRRRRRVRKTEEDYGLGCLVPLVLYLGGMAFLGFVLQLLAATVVFVRETWPLILISVAAAIAAVFGVTRWWRGRRDRRPFIHADEGQVALMDPYDFEHYVASIFRRDGFEATVTRSSRDEGYDIELRDNNGELGLVQCKQTVHQRHGRVELDRLRGVMTTHHASFGYFVTTGSFSEECPPYAARAGIQLVDRIELMRWIAEG